MRIKTTRLLGSLLSVMLMLAWAGSVSAVGFSGTYATGNWTASTPGGGSVDVSGAPNSIVLTGSDLYTCCDVNTDFSIVVLTAGLVEFDWDYATSDEHPIFDPFGYTLDGVFTQLTDGVFTELTGDGVINDVDLVQSGSESIMVGQNVGFGFRVQSDDEFGSSSVTISNFVGPEMDTPPGPGGSNPVPEPSAALLFAIAAGVVGQGTRRNR